MSHSGFFALMRTFLEEKPEKSDEIFAMAEALLDEVIRRSLSRHIPCSEPPARSDEDRSPRAP